MRVLVLSDSHGDEISMRDALLEQPTAEVVIFLGDGENEAQRLKRNFPEKMFLLVKGNCDWGSELPTEGMIKIEGANIFYTHGYTYNVKSGLYQLESAARGRKADIVLYGHTHIAEERFDDGLYVMNPGAISGYKSSYGAVDITPSGILMNIIQKK